MPEIEAKRILLLGLGSNGNEILREVREKIRWEFGDPDALRWIRCLGVETHSGTRELEPVDTLYITMEKEPYQSVLRNPGQYQEQLRLEDWLDVARVRSAGMDAVTTGAGNNRMIGRLALLMSTNFGNVYQAIQQRLDQLFQLTARDAESALEAAFAGTKWEVQFTESDVEIITVGTLCGGTCSGTFIDIGYLLRRIAGQMSSTGGTSRKVETRGIFTLPAKGVLNGLHGANAFAALTELDFFSDTINRYRIKYPDEARDRDYLGETPYDRTFLVEAGGTDIAAVHRLNNVVSHYLYARAMFPPVRRSTDGKAIDGVASHFDQVSRCGAPQRYLTFGLANLEYPTRQIRRACSARLISETLGEWLKPMTNDADPLWLRRSSLDEGKIRGILLKAGDRSVFDGVTDILNRNSAAAALSTLGETIHTLPNVFSTTDPNAAPFGDLEVELIRKTVRGNWMAAYAAVVEEWKKRVDLLFSGGGNANVGSAVDMVIKEAQAARSWLQTDLKRLQDRNGAGSQNGESDSLYSCMEAEHEQARACSEDPMLRMVPWGSAAAKRHIESFFRCAHGYAETRTAQVIESEGLIPLYSRLLNFAEGLLKRVEVAGNAVGLQATVERLKASFQAVYEREASTLPNTPGRVIFTPREEEDHGKNTVDIAYLDALAALRSAPGDYHGLEPVQLQMRLQARLLKRWMTEKRLVEELFREPASFWDPVRDEKKLEERRKVDENDIHLYEDETVEIFASIANTSVLDKMGQSEIRLLPDVNREAGLQLALNLGDICHSNDSSKSWKFLFHPDASQKPEIAAALSAAVTDCHIKNGAVVYADIRRILILEERCAFPLSSLTSIVRWADLYEQARQSGTFLHNRKDVSFSALVSGPGRVDELSRASELFLTGLGLGVIRWDGAGTDRPYRFEYMDHLGQRRTLEMPTNIRSVEQLLNLHADFAPRLDSEIQSEIQSRTPAVASAQLRAWAKKVGLPPNPEEARQFVSPLPLTLEEVQAGADGSSRPPTQVSSDTLYASILSYAKRQDYALYQAMKEAQEGKAIQRYTYYAEGDKFPNGKTATMSGFYCNCGQRVAPADNEQSVPERCPNCRQVLKIG